MFNFFKRKKKEEKSILPSLSQSLIIKTVEQGKNLMLDTNHKNNNALGANFEVSILSSLILLNEVHDFFPNHLSTFTKGTSMAINEAIKKFKSSPPKEIYEFITLRYEQYEEELERLKKESAYIPVNTLYNLYDTPMKPLSGEVFDLGLAMKFKQGYLEYKRNIFNVIQKTVVVIIAEEKKLI